jgi:hypothetical protein
MRGKTANISVESYKNPVVIDMSDFYTGSFTEFYPFCHKLYYFSNYKDFNTFVQD